MDHPSCVIQGFVMSAQIIKQLHECVSNKSLIQWKPEFLCWSGRAPSCLPLADCEAALVPSRLLDWSTKCESKDYQSHSQPLRFGLPVFTKEICGQQ